MTTRSRRQTRQLRTTPYYRWPDVHNEAVAYRKARIRADKRAKAERRELDRALRNLGATAWQAARGIRTLSVALTRFGQNALAESMREQERQRQMAWADRMAFLGFDMRDEHDALERGELID